ncbi:MAG: DUF2185 domain-containing protein [Sphingomonadaceae bacterium]|nr:DUF2185 domain-containing protein [Sphingomonadaceae bacterium]
MSEGSYVLDDPRPIASEAPYTYYLPPPEELAAIGKGDLVQLVFRPVPTRDKWGAERMWVTVTGTRGNGLVGTLDTTPDDMPFLKPGDPVAFERFHIIDCIWAEERPEPPPLVPRKRSYWDRCVVERCVTEDKVPVHYLYREEPCLTEEGDEDPDSGWRIRGDYRGLTDEEVDARDTRYLALGRVLNVDDSWLHLIDAPVGSAFIRDWETGNFIPLEE